MRIAILVLMLSIALPASADWQPNADRPIEVEAAAVLEAFHNDPSELAKDWIDGAVGYAVFPSYKRGALIFGWASGVGVVIEGDESIGTVKARRFSLGAQAGYKSQAQVIVFRTQAALDAFKAGHIEFTPAASAAAGSADTATEGGFNPDVAIFSFSAKGLMAEASAGASHYRFKPFPLPIMD